MVCRGTALFCSLGRLHFFSPLQGVLCAASTCLGKSALPQAAQTLVGLVAIPSLQTWGVTRVCDSLLPAAVRPLPWHSLSPVPCPPQAGASPRTDPSPIATLPGVSLAWASSDSLYGALCGQLEAARGTACAGSEVLHGCRSPEQ